MNVSLEILANRQGCIIALVSATFEMGVFPSTVNNTLIVLISKLANLEYVKQFHPIRLCFIIDNLLPNYR